MKMIILLLQKLQIPSFLFPDFVVPIFEDLVARCLVRQ